MPFCPEISGRISSGSPGSKEYKEAGSVYRTEVQQRHPREKISLPSAITLPPPTNPSYCSTGVAVLLAAQPATAKFRHAHRARIHVPSASKPVPPSPFSSTDKITQFLPPTGNRLLQRPADLQMANEPSASWSGYTPRSPRVPRRKGEEQPHGNSLPPRPPPNKAKILGYTGHVPNRRFEIDGNREARVWESHITTTA
eukprot:Hpha_TRINITY_DN15498_c1_g3::TRINITY_DN15498_c1_g3_i1::g.173047::m.173047